MPTSNDVKLNLLPAGTEQGQVTLGVYVIEVDTVLVGKVTSIDEGDNPSPSKLQRETIMCYRPQLI